MDLSGLDGQGRVLITRRKEGRIPNRPRSGAGGGGDVCVNVCECVGTAESTGGTNPFQLFS